VNRLSGRQRLPADPRIVALAGGGGGVGRSTLAAEIARCLVRRGRSVLIVDCDPTNPTQLVRFGVAPSELPASDERFAEDAPLAPLLVTGDRKRPAILPLALVRQRPFTRPELRPEVLIAKLRGLDFDLILLDLPAIADPVWSGLFVESDVPILVAATEATSLLGTTRALRHALVHALLRHPAAAAIHAEASAAVDALPTDFTRADWAKALSSRELSDLAARVHASFETYLVLLRTREVAERELAPVIAFVWSRTLGHRPRPLGCIDQDERRWFHLRQDETAPAMTADGGFGNQAEELAKRLMAIEETDAATPHVADESHACDVFAVPPDDADLALRQAYRRLWEGLRRDSAVTRTLVTTAQRDALLRELEAAHKELQVWIAERNPGEAPPPTTAGRPLASHPGEPVRRARQAAGLSARELSLRTRIGLRYIEAIEQFELPALPRPVYLRGYLREIARCLDLDGDGLLDDYLTAVSDARSDRILTRDPDPTRS
jgi:flagellar biosynthesis protein FlhG